MSRVSAVKGLDKLKVQLDTHGDAGAKGMRRGLLKAGFLLQRESQKLVPVEFGVLRGSANTIPHGTGAKTEVVVGYEADYAIYVHEDLEAQHKPGKQAKYLEQPFREHRQDIVDMVAAEIQKEVGL